MEQLVLHFYGLTEDTTQKSKDKNLCVEFMQQVN